MCAKFHKEKNLIVSGSLDQTIRLWNYDRLVQKMSVTGGTITQVDVELVCVIEAHDKGINWVSFHPKNDWILSASDDRRVKIWKFTESNMTEYETFFGHSFNVCCVEASPKTNQILSNSEDCTLKLWDDNGVCLDTYSVNGEKQWMIECHKNLPLVAIGLDHSLVILALDTTKFPSASLGGNGFYIKNFDFVMKDLHTDSEKVIFDNLNRGSSSVVRSGKPSFVSANQFSQGKWGFLVTYNETKSTDSKVYFVEVDKKTYHGSSKLLHAKKAVFISKNKIAFLNNGAVELSDTDTLLSLGSIPGLSGVDEIFDGGIGKFIFKQKTQIKLYDTVSKQVIGSSDEMTFKKMMDAVWNKPSSICAVVCKKSIFIFNKSFQRIARVIEGYKILGAIWTEDNVLIYTTYNHIKYLLPNGDTGILRSIDKILYPVEIKDSTVYCFDQNGDLFKEKIDSEQYLFKLSIKNTNIKQVKEFIKNNKSPGNAVVSYLVKKNIHSVALTLALDEKSKFQLALKSGNLQAAYEAANKIKSKDCFAKLAHEALKQGCNPLIEIGLQESQSYQKLVFLHQVTGNTEALEELSSYLETEFSTKEAKKQITNLESIKFQAAMYQSNMENILKLSSKNSSLLPLSYYSAKIHGLDDLTEPLRKSLDIDPSKIKWSKKATALVPLKPLVKSWEESSEIMNGWPIFEVSEEKAAFEAVLDSDEENDIAEIDNGKEDPSEDSDQESEEAKQGLGTALDDWKKQDDFGDLDLESSENVEDGDDVKSDQATVPQKGSSSDVHIFVQKDNPVESYVKKSSILAADFAAIGRFDMATEKLSNQLGIEDGPSLKKSYLDLFMSSEFFTTPFDFMPPAKNYITKQDNSKSPYIVNDLKSLEKKIQNGYNLTTKAQFADAITAFREVIQKVTLLSVDNKSDVETAKKMIEISSEYIFALLCDQLKKNQKDQDEVLRLTIVMSLMNLQPIHRVLTLRSALSACFKAKNYITCSFIARRLLKLFQDHPKLEQEELTKQVKKILQKSEKTATNETQGLDFDEKAFYDTEITQKLNPVNMKFLGDAKTKISLLTGARYEEKMAGKICLISGINLIGKDGIGLKILNNT